MNTAITQPSLIVEAPTVTALPAAASAAKSPADLAATAKSAAIARNTAQAKMAPRNDTQQRSQTNSHPYRGQPRGGQPSSGQRSEQPEFYRHLFSSMGCPAEISLHAGNKAEARQAIAAAEAEVHRLDRKYSHYRNDSYLSRLNRQVSRSDGVPVDSETAGLLDFAACQFRTTEGRFDITAGALTALWENARQLPSQQEINTALAITGWQHARWSDNRLYLPAGFRINLGGVVKEYAADRAAWVLRQHGIRSACVDLGGDLHVLGPHPDGSPWHIGIRHPRQPGAIASLTMTHGGLATSGDYERFTLLEGKRYSHLIDPRTGHPVRGLASVSVVAPNCLLAGGISTLAMLHSVQNGLELLHASGLSWLAHNGE